jgi:endonuclease I
MKKFLALWICLFTIGSIIGQVQSYYNGIDFNKSGNELFLLLSERLSSTHTAIPYTAGSPNTWDVLKVVDEDPENAANVLLLYGYDDFDDIAMTDRTRLKSETDTGGGDQGKWNREHVFARSLAIPALTTDNPGPGTDVHNLRPADATMNSTRSNRKFTAGSGDAGVALNGGWYPGDEWIGDVARMMMYMYLRYNGDGSSVAKTQCYPVNVGIGDVLEVDENMIELFLLWNVEDPISDLEKQRNDYVEEVQGNRNPFIDNPYLATMIWGGLNAEDTWNLNNSSDTEAPTVPTNVVVSAVTNNSVSLSWSASTDNVEVLDYLIFVDGVYKKSTSSTNITITGLDGDTTYSITVTARDSSNNQSEASVPVVATTLPGPEILFEENFSDCNNLKFFAFNEASNKDWQCETQYGENNSGSMGINGYQQVKTGSLRSIP